MTSTGKPSYQFSSPVPTPPANSLPPIPHQHKENSFKDEKAESRNATKFLSLYSGGRRRKQRGGQLPGIGSESGICGPYQSPDEREFTPDKYIVVPQIEGGSSGPLNGNSIAINLAKTHTQAKANAAGDFKTAETKTQDDTNKQGNINLDGVPAPVNNTDQTNQDNNLGKITQQLFKHASDHHGVPIVTNLQKAPLPPTQSGGAFIHDYIKKQIAKDKYRAAMKKITRKGKTRRDTRRRKTRRKKRATKRYKSKKRTATRKKTRRAHIKKHGYSPILSRSYSRSLSRSPTRSWSRNSNQSSRSSYGSIRHVPREVEDYMKRFWKAAGPPNPFSRGGRKKNRRRRRRSRKKKHRKPR